MPVAIAPMYTGKQLGDALKAAMDLKKKAKSTGATQNEVAKEFGVKQPSVAGWQSNGRIHKKHLNRLVEFFSDVVGPEHWGMPVTWGTPTDELLPLRDGEPALLHGFRLLDQKDQDEIYAQVRQLVMAKHGPTMRAMERLNVTRRADDASVEIALGGQEKKPDLSKIVIRATRARAHKQPVGGKAIRAKKSKTKSE